MPQMSPLMWFTLFILFSTMMISFNLINFFSFKYEPMKLSKTEHDKKSMNWKW
uniref:ATP synthase complex subunit 8 n=1 Tax=Tanaocerus koebelei TaxID=1260746 RepID=M4JC81_9ORTH|nr:ATP synthase F0 subunit 8 [Tanaocerus koebelei]AGC22376.1 ATP synthase F0 subunit 8 [Tanaocerus koebelei]